MTWTGKSASWPTNWTLSAGMGNVAALAIGNIVLVSAGYPPAPVYVPETE